MWNMYVRLAARYAPQIGLPFAIIIGACGYLIEGRISNRYTPATAPIKEQRAERLLENIDSKSPKKKHNPLEFNLSPSLTS